MNHIPFSSVNTKFDEIVSEKERIIVYNKANLADESMEAVRRFSSRSFQVGFIVSLISSEQRILSNFLECKEGNKERIWASSGICRF